MPNYVTPDSLGTDGSLRESWSPAARKAAEEARKKKSPLDHWKELTPEKKQFYINALKKVYAGKNWDQTRLARTIKTGKVSLAAIHRTLASIPKPDPKMVPAYKAYGPYATKRKR